MQVKQLSRMAVIISRLNHILFLTLFYALKFCLWLAISLRCIMGVIAACIDAIITTLHESPLNPNYSEPDTSESENIDDKSRTREIHQP